MRVVRQSAVAAWRGRSGIDFAIPSFGYKSSIAICRRYGFIRRGKVTDGARFDGRMLRDVVTRDNTASDVWADTAYRSRSNEAWLKSIGRVSRVHRKKPGGKPMPARTAHANAAKSTVRARVEHVFARHMLDGLGDGDVLLADRAYDSDVMRATLAARGAWACVKPMPNRKRIPPFNPFLYRHRNLVERFFNTIKYLRAVVTRYDKRDDNFLASVQLASIRIWLRYNESAT
jgi:transposase